MIYRKSKKLLVYLNEMSHAHWTRALVTGHILPRIKHLAIKNINSNILKKYGGHFPRDFYVLLSITTLEQSLIDLPALS